MALLTKPTTAPATAQIIIRVPVALRERGEAAAKAAKAAGYELDLAGALAREYTRLVGKAEAELADLAATARAAGD